MQTAAAAATRTSNNSSNTNVITSGSITTAAVATVPPTTAISSQQSNDGRLKSGAMTQNAYEHEGTTISLRRRISSTSNNGAMAAPANTLLHLIDANEYLDSKIKGNNSSPAPQPSQTPSYATSESPAFSASKCRATLDMPLPSKETYQVNTTTTHSYSSTSTSSTSSSSSNYTTTMARNECLPAVVVAAATATAANVEQASRGSHSPSNCASSSSSTSSSPNSASTTSSVISATALKSNGKLFQDPAELEVKIIRECPQTNSNSRDVQNIREKEDRDDEDSDVDDDDDDDDEDDKQLIKKKNPTLPLENTSLVINTIKSVSMSSFTTSSMSITTITTTATSATPEAAICTLSTAQATAISASSSQSSFASSLTTSSATTTASSDTTSSLPPSSPLAPLPSSSSSSLSACSSSSSSSSVPSSLPSSPPSSSPSSTKASPSMKNLSISGIVEADLLQWQDMPKYLQFNPYVLKGYRPLQTFKGCLLSLFYWHNETINILTHAIPIVYILAIIPGLMPWENGYRFLSFCHVFGSVAPWCGSFVYHLFMNIERGENVYYTLLKLDMVGIWVSQSFGALPLVTATTYCFANKWKWLIIITYCIMSLWGLYKALTASSPWQRRLCFALPFTMRSILTFFRTLGLIGGSQAALPHVYLQDGVSVFGGAIGAMRIPEKWFPGLVDFYLNSHNIMHVLVVVAVYSMHKATIRDFEWMETANCDDFKNVTSKVIETTLKSNIEL